MKFKIAIMYIILWMASYSCSKFQVNFDKNPIARVNQEYLYREQIIKQVPKNAAKGDSSRIVQEIINRWAIQKLFLDQAKRNLKERELEHFDSLVENYRNALYTHAYKEAMVRQSLHAKITNKELKKHYKKNKQNFVLSEDLIKVRYLHLPLGYKGVSATRQKLERFNRRDQKDLEKRKLEYVAFSLYNTEWVAFNQVLTTIPLLKRKNREQVLRKGSFFQLRDPATGTYMIVIRDVLRRGKVAPLQFRRSIVEQIILNKRKKEQIKRLEKDILKDAIQYKQFEIFDSP